MALDASVIVAAQLKRKPVSRTNSVATPGTTYLDNLVHRHIAPLMLQHDFKRAGRAFTRRAGPLYHVVSIQRSRWDDSTAARATVNLMVTLPPFHEAWAGSVFPANPASAAAVLSARIGSFLQESKDKWWLLDSPRSVKDAGTEITAAVATHGIPFLESLDGLEALVAYVGQPGRPLGLPARQELVRAVLLHAIGDKAEASHILSALVAEDGAASESASVIASRLGVPAG